MTANYYIIPGIKRDPPPPPRIISFDDIMKMVSIYTGLSKEQITQMNRKREVVFARHLVYYFARQVTPLSLKSIGENFGHDHTTVINGVSKITGFLKIKDDGTCTAVEAIDRMLKR